MLLHFLTSRQNEAAEFQQPVQFHTRFKQQIQKQQWTL